MKQSIILLITFFFSIIKVDAQYWTQKGADILGVNIDASTGASIALSDDGNTLVVGSNYETVVSGLTPGYVQVYDWDGNSWVQRGSNIVSGYVSINDWFGETVSISPDGNTVAIGAPNVNIAQVYNWNGFSWVQKGSNINSFCFSVDIDGSGDLIVLRDDQPAGVGEVIKVYLYDNFDWVQIAPDIIGEELGEAAGVCVSLSGNGSVLAYGSPNNSGNGTGGGSVRTYNTSGFQIGNEINGSVSSSLGGSTSGSSVSLNGSGNRLAIGDATLNNGEVIVYEFNSTWNQLGSPITGIGGSGNSVELNSAGNRIVVGDFEHFFDKGAMRTFLWNGTDWVQYGQTIVNDSIDDGFGYSVSMSSDGFTIAGSAPGNDINGDGTGMVRVYEYCAETTNSISPVACVSYTVPSGDETYSSSGSYSDTLTNIQGCDSVLTINLTIANNSGTDIQSACESYTWIDGNTYVANNNTATHILTNTAGCDSVVTLDLTITNSTSGTDVQSACNSYTWIDGNTYTSSNNSATHTLTNSVGCDSVVTLDLTITNSTSGTDIQTACNSFTWINGNTYTTSNNTATHTLTNVAGCDSVVTLDLTITNSTSGTDQQTACKSFTWIDGNTYTATNNTATHTLTNAAGCDSVVTLDLTINSISDLSTTTSGVTITATNTGAGYQWLDCDDGYAVIPGETGQSFTASVNGNYAVELTENECLDTSACVSISNVGIIENSFGNTFTVYPNPTEGNFSIDLGSVYEKAQVSILDASGRVVYSKAITQSQVIPLSIEESAGVYLVTIVAGEKRAVVRLIKN